MEDFKFYIQFLPMRYTLYPKMPVIQFLVSL